MKIYLAGPDVFLSDPWKIAQNKQEICQKYGFMGVFPLDNTLNLTNLSPFEAGIEIYKSNIQLMDTCDLIVANMTPFRGPSMDVGTAFEMGYMAAKNKPLFGYTNDGRLYIDRVTKSTSDLDDRGMRIEPFQMRDNLMLEGAIWVNGGVLKSDNLETEVYYTDLRLFEEVIQIAATILLS